MTKCRFCRCTEDKPCTLPTGEVCMLSVVTNLCTNPCCILAAGQEARRIAARRREELAAMVRPIAERWRQSWNADRARRRRPGTKKKNPNRKPQGRAA